MPSRRLLHTFIDLPWAGGPVDMWLGDTPVEGVEVSSVCALLHTGEELLPARVIKWGWDFPGGHVEPGESVEQALWRELDEEAGIRPDDVRDLAVIGWFIVFDTGRVTQMLVLAAHLVGRGPFTTRVPEEIAEVRLLPVNLLPAGTQELIWCPLLETVFPGR